MGRITYAVLALAKSHPLVSHQLHPISRAPIGISSSMASSSSTAALGPLLAAIFTRTIKALIHIRFPVSHDLRFIAISFTIWEQMVFSTIETLRSVLRVLGWMMPTLALRKIPSIRSVKGVVAVIFQDDNVQDALESDRGGNEERHSRAHLSDTFLI